MILHILSWGKSFTTKCEIRQKYITAKKPSNSICFYVFSSSQNINQYKIAKFELTWDYYYRNFLPGLRKCLMFSIIIAVSCTESFLTLMVFFFIKLFVYFTKNLILVCLSLNLFPWCSSTGQQTQPIFVLSHYYIYYVHV